MLGLAPLLAPAGIAAGTAVVILLLLLGYFVLFRPFLDAMGLQAPSGGGLLKRIAYWPVRKVVGRIESFVKGHLASLSYTYLGKARAAVKLLDGITEVTRRLAGTLGDMSAQLFTALQTLRRVTIPQLIEQAVAPLRAQLTRIVGRLDILEGRDAAAAVIYGNLLRALPWGVGGDYIPNLSAWANTYKHLWTQTFDFLAPKLEQVRTVWFPAVWERLTVLERLVEAIREVGLPAIRGRLDELESALGELPAQTQEQLDRLIAPALFALASLTAIQRLAPNLFCRNVNEATKAACGLDPDIFDSLLLGSLLLVGPISIVELARAVQGTMGVAVGAIDDWIVES